jgi:phosphoribosyl 1,2-cyclic phosphodiesterase
VRLTFLGVRGSSAASGADSVRYGGHTSCVAVTADGADIPTVMLDAGTGLTQAPPMLDGRPYAGSILLSHLHWDHVNGIPFFASGDRDGSRVEVFMPAQLGRTGEELLGQLMSPPAFPIYPDGLRGDWTFSAMEAGIFSTQGFTVRAVDVTHKGGRTFGYVLADVSTTIGYLPDHAPALGMTDELVGALSGVDVLIHDGQFLDTERTVADLYGHATVSDAMALAERVKARQLVLFHHGPNRRDDDLDELARVVGGSVPVTIAHEGMVYDSLA